MKQVLLVEDDRLIGTLMTMMLRDMGLHVCGTETTEAGAVEAALRLRPDLMIVDARLGSGSGIAAMATIQLHMDIPHLFMSGAHLHTAPGGAPTLQKPFTEQGLAAVIGRVLGISITAG